MSHCTIVEMKILPTKLIPINHIKHNYKSQCNNFKL